MVIKVVVLEPNPELAAQLKDEFEGCAAVEVVCKPSSALWTHEGLDAIYVSAPMAERWGARPLLYEAQVLETTPQDRSEGLPPVVIAGVAVDDDEDRHPSKLLRLMLEITFRAVDQFNATHLTLIGTVGFLSQHLLGSQLMPTEIGECLRQVLCPESPE